MNALNLGRVGTPIPQKIWDVFLFVSPYVFLAGIVRNGMRN
ncbi:MAG: hypothetical protein V7K50_21860 [Nostoc sp.]